MIRPGYYNSSITRFFFLLLVVVVVPATSNSSADYNNNHLAAAFLSSTKTTTRSRPEAVDSKIIPAPLLAVPFPEDTIKERTHSSTSFLVRRQQQQQERSLLLPEAEHSHLLETGILSLCLAATIAVVSPSAAVAADPSITAGQVLFDNNCASCHRGGENIMKPGKTLKASALQKNLGGTEPTTIAKFFAGSMQHKMLSFPKVEGGKLSSDDVQNVASYISNQAVQDLWQ